MDIRSLIDSFEDDLAEDLLDCLEKEYSCYEDDPVLGMITEKRLDLLKIRENREIQFSHLSKNLRKFLASEDHGIDIQEGSLVCEATHSINGKVYEFYYVLRSYRNPYRDWKGKRNMYGMVCVSRIK